MSHVIFMVKFQYSALKGLMGCFNRCYRCQCLTKLDTSNGAEHGLPQIQTELAKLPDRTLDQLKAKKDAQRELNEGEHT